MTRLVREFGIHEKTGVLQTFWRERGTGVPYYGVEPDHILIQGTIEAGKDRKRGVWDFADVPDKYPAEIYYTCPWCGAIGRTSIIFAEMGPDRQSLVCGSVNFKYMRSEATGCRRHLTLSFRKPGKEKEGFSDYEY